MSGPQTLPWRYACPGERHQGLRRRSDGVYCQSCDATYGVAIDLRDDVAVSITDIQRSQSTGVKA